MREIYTSAAKLVFLSMAIGVNVALFAGFITSEQYLPFVAMAFTFYFSNKGDATKDYAGK